MEKKDLSKLTPEELMVLAKIPIKINKKSNLSPVKEFIVSEDICSGTTRIPALLIYDRYTTWCKANSIRPIPMSIFFKELKLHFTRIKLVDMAAYLLNPMGFDLSPAHLKKIRQDYGKRISKNDNKKSKKKQDEKENE